MTPLDVYFRSMKLFFKVEISVADTCKQNKHAIKISSPCELSELSFCVLFVVICHKWHFGHFLCLGHITGHLSHISSFCHKNNKDEVSIYHICGFWTKTELKKNSHCERHLLTLAHMHINKNKISCNKLISHAWCGVGFSECFVQLKILSEMVELREKNLSRPDELTRLDLFIAS